MDMMEMFSLLLNSSSSSPCYFHSSETFKNMIFLIVEAAIAYYVISGRRSKKRHLALKILNDLKESLSNDKGN